MSWAVAVVFDRWMMCLNHVFEGGRITARADVWKRFIGSYCVKTSYLMCLTYRNLHLEQGSSGGKVDLVIPLQP